MKLPSCFGLDAPLTSAFAGFRYPPEVIVVAVRWCRRFKLTYRDIEELLLDRDVGVDHAAVYPAVLDELIPSAWHHPGRSVPPTRTDTPPIQQPGHYVRQSTGLAG